MILDSPGPTLPTSESHSVFKTANDPEERLKARYELLASLPLPEGVPDDELKPLVFPGTMTIKEFILGASNVRPLSICNTETNIRYPAPVAPKRVLFPAVISLTGLTLTLQVVELPHPPRTYDFLVSRSRRTWLYVGAHLQVHDEPAYRDSSQLECCRRRWAPRDPDRMFLQQGRKVVLRWDVSGGQIARPDPGGME